MLASIIAMMLSVVSLGACSPDVNTGELGDGKMDKVGFMCTWEF